MTIYRTVACNSGSRGLCLDYVAISDIDCDVTRINHHVTRLDILVSHRLPNSLERLRVTRGAYSEMGVNLMYKA
jgi:hypothetical protein